MSRFRTVLLGLSITLTLTMLVGCGTATDAGDSVGDGMPVAREVH